MGPRRVATQGPAQVRCIARTLFAPGILPLPGALFYRIQAVYSAPAEPVRRLRSSETAHSMENLPGAAREPAINDPFSGATFGNITGIQRLYPVQQTAGRNARYRGWRRDGTAGNVTQFSPGGSENPGRNCARSGPDALGRYLPDGRQRQKIVWTRLRLQVRYS